MNMARENSRRTKAARVFELIVGVVFLITAWGKMGDVSSFGELIIKYGLPFFSILAPLIVAFEALCGLMLVFRLWPRATAAVTAAMLVAFTSAFFYANNFRGVADCGCFGSLGPSAPAWLTYSRNAVLLVLCLLIIFWERKTGDVDSKGLRWGLVGMVMTVAAFFIGFTFRVPSNYSSQLVNRHPLLDRTMAETGFDRFVTTSADSTYVFYVFSYSCTSCIDGINNIKRYDSRDICDRFYAFPVTHDTDSTLHRFFDIGFEEVFVGDSLQGVVTQLPTVLYVENNRIKFVIEGSVPSAYIFKQFYLETE